MMGLKLMLVGGPGGDSEQERSSYILVPRRRSSGMTQATVSLIHVITTAQTQNDTHQIGNNGYGI